MKKTLGEVGRKPSLADVDLTKVKPSNVVLPLEEFLLDAKRLINMFFNNDFDKSVEGIQLYSETSILHALVLNMLHFMQMMLTMSKPQIEIAVGKVGETVARIDKQRYVRSYKNLVMKPNYNNFTDTQCIAEITYVLSNLIYGCLIALRDQSVVGIINAGIKLNRAYRALNECSSIQKQKTNWVNEQVRKDFNASCSVTEGGFEILLSMCPAKLSKLLEYIGFNCDQKHAISVIGEACETTDLLTYPFASFILAMQHGALEYIYGLGDRNTDVLDKFSTVWTNRCPKGAVTHLINGLTEMNKSHFEVAIKNFKRMIDEQDYWPQLHFSAQIFMSVCYIALDDPENGLKPASRLRDKCKWSQSMFYYLHSIFLKATLKNQSPEEQIAIRKLISEQLKHVPSLKRKLGGVHVFHEELSISRSKKYHDNIDDLILPGFEILYFWNIFKMMESDKSLLDNKLNLIEDAFNDLKKVENDFKNKEAYYYLIFYKAVIYKYLHKSDEAETMFRDLIKNEKVLKFNNYLAPLSWFELSKIKYDQGEWKESKKCLKKVSGYSSYMGDGLTAYRVHLMNEKLKNQNKDP